MRSERTERKVNSDDTAKMLLGYLKRYRGLIAVLIGMCALCMTGCSVQRSLRADVRSRMYEVTRDTVRETAVVVDHDTLREVTTITIQQNEAGDTVKQSIVTDLTRARVRDNVVTSRMKSEVVRDTVFIEKRDSVSTTTNLSGETKKRSTLVGALKWVFFIILGLIVLVIVFRFNFKK